MLPTGKREQFLVRVCRDRGTAPAGVGFLISRRGLLTCAHVVNTALGRSQRSQEAPGPDARITVQFQLLSGDEAARTFTARVASWTPPPQDQVLGGDVAGLVLEEDPPASAARAALINTDLDWGSPVYLFGFPGNPPRRDRGAWATVSLRGRVGSSALQLDQAAESALRTQPGYSGAPLVVEADGTDRVAGMLAVASAEEEDKDAYALPMQQLSDGWRDAAVLSAHREASAHANRVFTRQLGTLIGTLSNPSKNMKLASEVPEEKFPLVQHQLGVHRQDLVAVWGTMGRVFPSLDMALTRHGVSLRIHKGYVFIDYGDLPGCDIRPYQLLSKTRSRYETIGFRVRTATGSQSVQPQRRAEVHHLLTALEKITEMLLEP